MHLYSSASDEMLMKNFCSQFDYAIEYLPKNDQSLDEARMHTFILVYYVLFLICFFVVVVLFASLSVLQQHIKMNMFLVASVANLTDNQGKINHLCEGEQQLSSQSYFGVLNWKKNYSIIGNWQQKGQENQHTAIR